jgi:hypothetical protein
MECHLYVGAMVVLAIAHEPGGELVGPVRAAHQWILLSDCHGLGCASGSKHDQSAWPLYKRASHHELSAVIELRQVAGMEVHDFAAQPPFRNRMQEYQVVLGFLKAFRVMSALGSKCERLILSTNLVRLAPDFCRCGALDPLGR